MVSFLDSGSVLCGLDLSDPPSVFSGLSCYLGAGLRPSVWPTAGGKGRFHDSWRDSRRLGRWPWIHALTCVSDRGTGLGLGQGGVHVGYGRSQGWVKKRSCLGLRDVRTGHGWSGSGEGVTSQSRIREGPE